MTNPMKIGICVLILVCVFMFAHHDKPHSMNVSIGQPQKGNADNTRTDNEQISTLAALINGQKEQVAKQKKQIADLQLELQQSREHKDDHSEVIVDQVVSKLKKTGGFDISNKVENQLLSLKQQVRDLTNTHSENDNKLMPKDFGVHTNTTPKQIIGGGSLSNANDLHLRKPISDAQVKPVVSDYQPDKSVNGWYMGEDVSIDAKSKKVEPALSSSEIRERNLGLDTQVASSLATKDGKGKKNDDPVAPYVTIPQEATLTGATTMTALLGRIPVNGKLVDPYEFDVLVGKENLAANGLYVPNISRIVMRGVAKGDYTGQCASGDIVSATFVFQDGRIETINASDASGGKNDYESAGTVTKNRLGWISTPGGVPCLSGQYISDAPKFIALQGGLAALTAGANAFSAAATSTTGTGDNKESSINSAGNFAAGQAVAGAAKSATDWVSEIKSSAFGLVYIPTDRPVDIHITKEMDIDYHFKGRKLFYGFNNGNGNVKNNLD